MCLWLSQSDPVIPVSSTGGLIVGLRKSLLFSLFAHRSHIVSLESREFSSLKVTKLRTMFSYKQANSCTDFNLLKLLEAQDSTCYLCALVSPHYTTHHLSLNRWICPGTVVTAFYISGRLKPVINWIIIKMVLGICPSGTSELPSLTWGSPNRPFCRQDYVQNYP